MTIARREGVSHETIYQAIYAAGGRGLPCGLHHHLHHRRRRSRCRRHGEQPTRRSPMGVFRPIATCPQVAAAREEIGHIEGDLIIGERGRSAVIALVDRATCFAMLGQLPYSDDACTTLDRLDRLFARLPDAGYHTLSWDRSREMAAWTELEHRTGNTVYFADPHSPGGEQERLNRYIRERVLTEAEAKAEARGIESFDELNDHFGVWAEQVANTRIHAETKQTSLARFLSAGLPRRPDPDMVREAFRWSITRRVTKTATVSLFANRYGVNPSLLGRTVELRFDPEGLSAIDVFCDGVAVGRATPFVIGRHVHPSPKPNLPSHPRTAASTS